MRGIALREIADENIVVDIATNVDRALIPVALYKLKDTQRLVALVKNWLSNSTALRWGDWEWMTGGDNLKNVALGKFTTEETFADIAKTGTSDGELYNDAGSFREERRRRRDAARRGRDDAGSFREECLARVKEQKLLADIVKNADLRAIREKAFERLTDEQLLVDVVKNAKEVEDAHRALSELAEMPLFPKEALVDAKKSMARFVNIEMLPVPGQSFLLAKTEITQAQWWVVMGYPSVFNGGNRPVQNVSWDDAMEFCKKLTEMERAAGRLPAGQEYTLPTEKQWEYACRAGTTGDYAGTGNLDDMGWYDGHCGGRTHDVATKQPNQWGFYDMHGNVWELCLDKYDPGDYHVIRGGSRQYTADSCRSASRSRSRSAYATYASDDLGFRPALLSIRGE
jgi:formylglycine-generating enzyme required for sulfatase activity